MILEVEMRVEMPINPSIGYRHDPGFIRGAYSSVDEAFSVGDYCFVIAEADPESELFYCALAVTGFIRRALDGFHGLATLSARGTLFKAFALWCLGASTAKEVASQAVALDPQHKGPRRLAELIAADRISVLQFNPLQLIHYPILSADQVPEEIFGQFHVLSPYVSDPEGKLWRPDVSLPQLKTLLPPEYRPDILLVCTPQFAVHPEINKIGCPAVLWIHDPEMFIPGQVSTLSAFDLILTCTSQEHFEVRHAAQARVASTFLAEPQSQPFDFGDAKPKDLDLLVTGSLLDANHPEKARALFRLSRVSDRISLSFVEGYRDYRVYQEDLQRARAGIIVSRIAGNPSPRWREALCNHGVAFYPKGTLYGALSEGLFPFEPDSFENDIAETLERLRDTEAQRVFSEDGSTWRSVIENYREFGVDRRQRQEIFYKTMTFVADCLPGKAGDRTAKVTPLWPAPDIESRLYGVSTVYRKMRASVGRVANQFGQLTEMELACYLSNEVSLIWCALEPNIDRLGDKPRHESNVSRVIGLFDQAVARFPNSFQLQFMRARCRYLLQPDNQESISTINLLLDIFDEFDFDPLNSLFAHPSWGRQDPMFPHIPFGSVAIEWGVTQRIGSLNTAAEHLEKMREMLRAVLLGYLGDYEARRSNWAAASEYYERALISDSQNIIINKNHLSALVRRLSISPSDTELAHAVVNAFCSAVDLYPTLIFGATDSALLACGLVGRTDEARGILADWYRFGRTLTLNGFLPLSIPMEKARTVLSNRNLLPIELRRRLEEWLSGETGKAELDTAFDALLRLSVARADINVRQEFSLIGNKSLTLDIQREARDRLAVYLESMTSLDCSIIARETIDCWGGGTLEVNAVRHDFGLDKLPDQPAEIVKKALIQLLKQGVIDPRFETPLKRLQIPVFKALLAYLLVDAT